MKIYAVISEFNPFHNGHKYLIDTLKKDGDSAVIAIMSGSFVERGGVSIIDKYARAEAAVLCGADLVLELPAPWCFAGAEFFALGGVSVANGLGIVDSLAFGSESGETSSLITCADNLSSEKFTTALEAARISRRDIGIATLRADVYKELFGESEHFVGSNDLLALEYIRALKRLGSDITPTAIKRIGEVYNSEELTEICSATAIRRVIAPEISDYSGRDLSRYMPKPSYDILERELSEGRIYALSRLDTAVLSFLRGRGAESLLGIMEVSSGIENRLAALATDLRTIEELTAAAKGRHYSKSRIRRLLIASLLGITMHDVETAPEFTTLLAANSRGRELLALARKRATIAILSQQSASKELDGLAAE
ncbi:MAG: nucleotidyltransferase family protein [Clostridia bacterium]|nr:nucleotidyltransferase family protein [Clostridia bacterium]